MSDRRVVCEAAFGFGPFDTLTETDWSELKETAAGYVGRPRLREASWSFGRDSELEDFAAGTATVVLSNRDRALDPDNPASPHAGDLLPYTPVRLRSKQPAFAVTAWARSSGIVFLTLDISLAPLPAIGTRVVVDVTDNTFDGTFTVTSHFGAAIVYAQAGSDVSNTPGSGVATEIADEFYGFVQGGWEQHVDTNLSECRLELVDYLGVFSGYQLPDVFEAAVLAHNPVGFWILDSQDAEQVPDLGSGKNDGTVTGEGVTLGDRVITPGHRPAARFDTVIVPETTDQSTEQSKYGSVYMGRSPIIATDATSLQNALLMVTFLARTAPANESGTTAELRALFVQGNGSTGVHIGNGLGAVIIQPANLGVTPGMLMYGVQSTMTAATLQTVVDGRPHLMFGSNETLALDSATLSTPQTFGYPLPKINGVSIGGGPGLKPVRHFDGWIGAAALFTSASTVGVSGRQEILDGYNKLDGLTSDAHIAWALDRLGVPAGKRNLSIGTVVMGPADTKGQDALAWMRQVSATEGGGLYVDHRDSGKVRYTDRYHRFLSARSVTSQATFSDQPGTAIRYPADGLEVAPNGLDGIINQATVTWRDGEVTVEDAASIAAYGPRNRQVDTDATTASQARSTGEWLVARYKDPRSRVRGCTVSARHTQQRDDRVQALRVDDRVSFEIQPLHTGTVTETDLYIDGVTHTASGVEWVTSFRFAPVDTFTPWVWGTSAWGTTKIWG